MKSSNKCSAITKKKKPCPILVEDWREGGKCHVHDPNGKFRYQVRTGVARKLRKQNAPKAKKKCQHAWYMKEQGIVCKKCLIVWDKSMETDSALQGHK
jgi:hypothetical protein